MKLICPACDAHYDVPDRVLKPEGQMVRCAKCGNRWTAFKSAPAFAAADGADGARRETPMEAAAVFTGMLDNAATAAPSLSHDDDRQLRATEKPYQKLDAEIARSRKYKGGPKLAEAAPVRATAVEKYIKAAVVVFLAGLLAFLIFGRGYVAQKLPFMMNVYRAIGLPAMPLGSGLAFINVQDASDFSESTNQLVIKGEIQNTTPYPLDVPLIDLAITAPGGQTKNFMTRPPVEHIAPGQNVPFTLTRRGFAKKDWKVMLSFGAVTEKPTHSPSGEKQ